MYDIKWIRENPQKFDEGLKARGLDALSAKILAMDAERRAHLGELQALQQQRNAASGEIGKAKAAGDDAKAHELIDEVAKIKAAVRRGEDKERQLTAALDDFLATIPNRPLDDVPLGADETDNAEIRRQGDPPQFPFKARQHFEIGEAMGLMDFNLAAKLSGSRFVVLKGALARLERALAAFMVDLHTREHGYREISPPILVNDHVMFGTAQLPKFADDQFRTVDGRWLIPTAEVPLTNLVRESVLGHNELPVRVTACTPCFRLEAGAAGRDTRGMLRQHQFSKVELVSIVEPEHSDGELERMLGCAEEVLKRLQIPYRVMLLCTGDMGFGARKTYDIEAWLPGQKTYREISSCSACGDFQARRMQARYKPDGGKATRFVHTLNGSGVAVGRLLIAVLENGQCEDGSVIIPDALRGHMDGTRKILANGALEQA